MNERIRELAEQAALATNEDPNGEYPAHMMQKFAELIVRECLQQCEQVRSDAATQKKSQFLTQDGKMLYEGVYGGATNCGFAIQQHFGVEK